MSRDSAGGPAGSSTKPAGPPAGVLPEGVPPPPSTTGAEVTAGVHWYRGVTLTVPVGDVLLSLQRRWGEAAVPLVRGQGGYNLGWIIGYARVYANLERPDMGVMVEIGGEACEALGTGEIANIHSMLRLRCARLDLAHDGCPFTPEMVREAWRAGDVRSRAKVPRNARPDRQWRKSTWSESAEGDLFTMGSRQSTQYARCYDRRGVTRFELELKGKAAEVAANQLLHARLEAVEGFASESLGWVRRFADFVDQASSCHTSRRVLLRWWADFVQLAAVARVTLAPRRVRTLEQVRCWVDYQVAPSLALLYEGYGSEVVLGLARKGKARWTARHRTLLSC